MIGNLELAKKIETESARDDAEYVRALRGVVPNAPLGLFEFEGGASVYAGKSPFSGTHGFGSATSDEKLLDRIEGFYESHSSPSLLWIPSVAPQATLKLLQKRGYQVATFKNAYIHDGRPRPALALDIREAKTPEEMAAWLIVVSNGFAGKELAEPDPISLGQSRKKGNRFFLGYLEDTPVSASTLYVHGDFARLGGMTTLSQFRGRGFQQAMLHRRLEECRDRTFITSDTVPGNDSQRNLERMGFRLAYVRTLFHKGGPA